jgi:glycosyltransferase involved in cell wall biosynthesis
MKSVAEPWGPPNPVPKLVIWHTEGTAISGLLSWMWRLKKSLPEAGIDLTLASMEIQSFRFPQVCEPEKIYDTRIRSPLELIAFLKKHRSSVHLINHAYEYVDLLESLHPALLRQLTLVGICHTDQDYYYQNLTRLDSKLSGIIAVSPRCVEKLEALLPHRRGTIPILPDWDMPIEAKPGVRHQNVNQPLNVLFNGRLLHLQKRVLDLPKISRQLAQLGASIKLTIVGDGPDLPQLREAFGQGDHISYRLLWPRAPWEMAKLLEEHDVFLQVSEFEGASVSLMEAMVAGMVPVVTKTESGTEFLENGRNAILCPVGNVDAIASSLADLVRNRSRIPELSSAAFETARSYLEDLNYVKRLGEYVEELQRAPAIAPV